MWATSRGAGYGPRVLGHRRHRCGPRTVHAWSDANWSKIHGDEVHGHSTGQRQVHSRGEDVRTGTAARDMARAFWVTGAIGAGLGLFTRGLTRTGSRSPGTRFPAIRAARARSSLQAVTSGLPAQRCRRADRQATARPARRDRAVPDP